MYVAVKVSFVYVTQPHIMIKKGLEGLVWIYMKNKVGRPWKAQFS